MATGSAHIHHKVKVPRDAVPQGASLCDYCTGKCCRYISLPIKTPHSWDDYDEIRWFLAHGRMIVYVEKATWYLLVMSNCQYLQKDYRCGIYFDRPKICREYTTDNCEYEQDWGFEKVFESPRQVWEYAEAILPPRRKPPAGGADGLVVLGSH